MMFASYHQFALFLLVAVIARGTVVTANNKNGKTPWALHNNNIQSHIQQYLKDPDGTARAYGAIKYWDTSNVTSLRNLFAFNEKFNEDISLWNVSQVTDFSSLFWDASSFDQNLGHWDVSKAVKMNCMFCGAKKFRGEGLQFWYNRLGHVEDMYRMFAGSGIDADLSEWQVSSVVEFREMFVDTPQFKQQLCWNVSYKAHAVDMFNNTEACFDNKCVLPHTSEEAGCSGAWSIMASSSVVFMATLTSVVLVASFL
jgi:surface protein